MFFIALQDTLIKHLLWALTPKKEQRTTTWISQMATQGLGQMHTITLKQPPGTRVKILPKYVFGLRTRVFFLLLVFIFYLFSPAGDNYL